MCSVIIAARRSPVAPRGGALSRLEIHDLARPVLDALLSDVDVSPDTIGELVVSNALGAGGNPARSIALAAGWPQRIGGLSIDRQCVGGLDALLLADAMIRSGQQELVVAGGVESYSRRPLRFRTFADGRDPEPYDQARFTPWPDRDPDMADAANLLAGELGIAKGTQDAWARDSHAKALQAGLLPEVVPMSGLERDSFTRALTDAHCRRAPVVSGEITAANMAVAADGAAFVLMASDRWARDHGFGGVELVAGKSLGGRPDMPGIAPVDAIRRVLSGAGLSSQDVQHAEIMEAFAVQAIACQVGADLPVDIVNPQGGALARGHPVGASGAILATRLFHALNAAPGFGLAAIAAAGGLGTALLLRGR
ncbi:thiolase family protein [Lutimaribacter marinistellae]|uniref:Thiolase family protein n=1 Tax=Lutimaribacter marinistellae TaxID=1820329 RepID=A0ABV7TDR3_9RHOB